MLLHNFSRVEPSLAWLWLAYSSVLSSWTSYYFASDGKVSSLLFAVRESRNTTMTKRNSGGNYFSFINNFYCVSLHLILVIVINLTLCVHVTARYRYLIITYIFLIYLLLSVSLLCLTLSCLSPLSSCLCPFYFSLC